MNGRPPVLKISPYGEAVETEHLQKMHVRSRRHYNPPPDAPMVFRVGSIAFWYNGELLLFAHVGKMTF